jgi:hypothetical protein
MPGLLEPGVACKLLLKAVVRQHTAAVEHMVGMEIMQQHMDAEVLEAMLLQMLKQGQCLAVLCQLPAAAHLSAEAAVRLLLEAIQRTALEATQQLCRVAAAQKLSSEQVATLLQASMRIVADTHSSSNQRSAFNRASGILRRVLLLPVAQQLASSDVLQLLYAAINMFTPHCTRELLTLPAAAASCSKDVTSLLHAVFKKPAAHFKSDHIIQQLVQLPAFA